MKTLVEVLKESFPNTILEVSANTFNVYSIIVTPDTDLAEFAGILEDVLPDYFPSEDFIKIYISKEGESREILVELNVTLIEVLKLELFIDGKQQVVTVIDEAGTNETFAVLDENGNSFGAIWCENEWECFEEILKPHVYELGKAIENR